MVVATSAAPTATGWSSWSAPSLGSRSMTSGTNSSFLARVFSSESTSMPWAAEAGLGASASVIGGRFGATCHATRMS